MKLEHFVFSKSLYSFSLQLYAIVSNLLKMYAIFAFVEKFCTMLSPDLDMHGRIYEIGYMYCGDGLDALFDFVSETFHCYRFLFDLVILSTLKVLVVASKGFWN